MTNSEILKQTADKLGLKLKKSQVVGVGAILEIKDVRGFKVRLSRHPQWIQIEIKVKSPFTIAFNQQEQACDKPLGLNDYPCRLFASNLEQKDQIISFVNKVRPLINEIDFKNIESLVIVPNQILADIFPDRDILMTIDKLIEIVEHIDQKIEIKKEINDLPNNLKDLFPLLEKWSISDDFEREELIDAMSKNEITDLVDTVGNRIADINSYLDSFSDRPLTENAQLLGKLAQLVLELKNVSR